MDSEESSSQYVKGRKSVFTEKVECCPLAAHRLECVPELPFAPSCMFCRKDSFLDGEQ